MDTTSGRTRAEFVVLRRRAGSSKETASLSLTPVVRISIVVIGNVPTSGFEESESKFGNLHLTNETRGHSFVSELSSLEVRSSSTGGTSVLHVSTLKSRAAEVRSKLASKGFSTNNTSLDTIESGIRDDVTELLTARVEPVTIKSLTETEGMDDFVHNADHLSFVIQDISSGGKISSTDDSLTDKGSTSARSSGTGGSTSNIGTGSISSDDVDPISVNTILKDRRSSDTTDRAGGDLHLSTSGVLDLESIREVVQNGRNKLVLDVVSDRTAGRAELTIVTISSEVTVAGKGSSSMVITFRVEFFFNIFDGGFLMVFVIMSTFVFKGLSKSEETDDVK